MPTINPQDDEEDDPEPTSPRKVPVAVFLCTACALVLTLIVWQAYTEDMSTSGRWGCAMSWMVPRFIEQSGPPMSNAEDQLGHYRLYLYREDGWDLSDRPTGYPVIFIPGNAGSMKQSRSIASSATKQYYDRPGHRSDEWGQAAPARPLDFFAVDFREELSAFHSPTLNNQARYLAKSIQFVLHSYDHLPVVERPTKVTLVGHSMGGIVAKLALTLDNICEEEPVDAIITLSTPHAEPPFQLDWGMASVYKRIRTFWIDKQTSLGHLPLLISLCGGVPDTQVPSEHCGFANGEVNNEKGLAVFTTGIEGVWTGVEHQAIVWCHQVRWVVANLLLLSRELDGPAFMDLAKRLLLDDHPLTDPRRDILENPSPPSTRYPPSIQRLTFSDEPAQHHLAIPPGAAGLLLLCNYSIDGIGPPSLPKASLAVCLDTGHDLLKGFGRQCGHDESSISVSWLPSITPNVNGSHFPPVGGDSGNVGFAHATVKLSPASQRTGNAYIELVTTGAGWLLVQTIEDDNVEVAKAASALRHTWEASGTSRRHTMTVSFPEAINSPLIVYKLTTHRSTAHCAAIPVFSAMLRHNSPSSPVYPVHEHQFHAIDQSPIRLHSHVGGNPLRSTDHTFSAMSVTLFQDPEDPCAVHSLDLRIDLRASLAKVVIRFRTVLLAWPVGVTALARRRQLAHLRVNHSQMSFLAALEQEILQKCVWIALVLPVLGAAGVPHPALWGLGTTHIVLLPLSILMMAVSGAFVSLFGVGITLASNFIRGQARSGRNSKNGLSRREVSRDLAMAGAALLLGSTIVPQQVIYVLSVGMVFFTSSWLPPKKLDNKLGNLLLLLWLLPHNIPATFIWLKQLLIHRVSNLPSDHNVLWIFPVILYSLCSDIIHSNSYMMRVLHEALLTAAAVFAFASIVLAACTSHIDYLPFPWGLTRMLPVPNAAKANN